MKRDLLLNQLVDACATLTTYIEQQSAVHAYMIADLSVQFAQWYQLSVQQIRDIYFAAMLHDLGEVVLRGDLLSKGGKLSAEEIELLRKHPLVAYRFLSRIPGFERVSCLVRWHHENYDGTGYPDRLSYQAIPLEVQILRTVDTFVSLQFDRPHRSAQSFEDAKRILWSERGRMCSYEVIKNFLSALEKKEIVFRKTDFSFPPFFEDSPEISSEECDTILVAFAIGLSDFISRRIPYLRGYGWRVAGAADAFAKLQNLSDSQRLLLFLASFLFETGMACLPTEIVLSDKVYSSEERKILEQHPNISAEIASKISIYPELAEIVRSHHERYDGSGYPRGLKGEEIPLLAQILSISATFVSLISPRPYRAAYRVPKALSILSRMMGKTFPGYLREFLTLLRQEYV